MNAISKITWQGMKQRLVIKTFKDNDSMHKFLNTQYDNKWSESKYEGLKAGTYAFAGGNWHNVKSLDNSLLAHV